MEFDNSWDALLKPGEATRFFDIHNVDPIQMAIVKLMHGGWLSYLV